MKPRGLLMAEHRLIERMISMVEDEAKKIKRDKPLNVEFIDVAVDFIRTYADRTHHGKEEEILFRDCAKKEMSKEDRYIMDGLIQEHQYSRNTLKELIAAKEKYLQGDRHQLETIAINLEKLAKLYPKHIQKEDDLFFPNSEKYFSQDELSAMLNEFREFDQRMIHAKYQSIVQKYEQLRS